jgi:2-polyprenyl-6-methoxyphenol hydroxylase-like FAD-dependent oxidoreductase
MLLQKKKVAVIGGGPAGLMFAKLLQQAGVKVNVYDRDINEYARITGGLIDFHKDLGQKAFEKAGLLPEFYKRSRPTGFRHTDIHGNILFEKYPDKDMLYLSPEIDRNDLRMMLYESLKPNTIAWDRKFVSLEEQDRKFLLHFENGITETADLVVGANGITSNIRKYITDTRAEYTGTVAIQGEALNPLEHCPNFKKLCGEENLAAIVQHRFFVAQTKAKGALHYYVCFRKPESWIKESGLNFNDNKQICAFLSDLFSNWNDVFKELFAATNKFTLLPMLNAPLGNWRPHNNMTLIGDAAHGMPPFAGVGGNLGLLDALYLAENLTNGKFYNIQTAISNYEEKMFEYALEAQQDTTKNEIAVLDNGIDFLREMEWDRDKTVGNG